MRLERISVGSVQRGITLFYECHAALLLPDLDRVIFCEITRLVQRVEIVVICMFEVIDDMILAGQKEHLIVSHFGLLVPDRAGARAPSWVVSRMSLNRQ